MAKAMSQSGVGSGLGKKPSAKSAKPKKLSKAGKWLEAHPNGLGGAYDMRAVMR